MPMRRIHVLLALVSVALSACAQNPSPPRSTASGLFGRSWVSTSKKYLPRAEAGDPEFQNLIGFMLFFGEGAAMNRSEAHVWFHKAADQGHVMAQRNLAIMHRLAIGVPQDLEEADFYARSAGIIDLGDLVATMPSSLRSGPREFKQDDPFEKPGEGRGESTYVAFCAGCHGLNGIAAYINSPSFAMGERLQKPDAVLLGSIRDGIGLMPNWGNKFSEERLLDVLAFVRSLEQRYKSGIAQAIRGAPKRYFLFGPMEYDDAAYRISY